MNKDRIHSIAQFMIQVSVAVLSIGAGVSGFLAQQGRTLSTYTTLALVWIGLMVIAGSVFINLKVLRTKDPINLEEGDNLEKSFNLAILAFVLGIFCIVVSPAGFTIYQLFTPPKLSLKTTSDTIQFDLSDRTAVDARVILIASDLSRDDYAKLSIWAIASDDSCLAVTNAGEQSPTFPNDTWLTMWTVSMSPGCSAGDYAVTFKALQEGYLRGQTLVAVKISP